jgi:signal transduction histidine kinase
MGQEKQALSLLDKKLLLKINSNNYPSVFATFYCNRAISLKRLGLKSESRKDFDKCLDYAKQDSQHTNLSYFQLEKARFAEEDGQFREAAQLYREAILNPDRLDNIAVNARLGLAKSQIKNGTPGNAILLADSALFIARNSHDLGLLHEALQASASIHTLMGDSAAAYRLLHEAMSVRDSMSMSTNQARLELNEREMMKELSEGQLKLVTSENKLKDLQITGGVILLCVGMVSLFFYLRYRRSREEIQTVAAELQGMEKERQRISAEIHDGVNGMLSIIRFNFISLSEHLNGVRSRQAENSGTKTPRDVLEKDTYRLIEQSMGEVSRISHDLDPTVVQRMGFKGAMEQLKHDIELTGLKVHFDYSVPENSLGQKVQNEVYRITQELFQNSRKHGQAQWASLQLRLQLDHKLYLSYEDNGLGFDVALSGKKQGMGLGSIQRRLKSIGAKGVFESEPGKGMMFFTEISSDVRRTT